MITKGRRSDVPSCDAFLLTVSPLPDNSPFDDQLIRRQHRGHSFVLPASPRAAHAALAGRALLRSRPADRDCFIRVCRAFVSRPVRAVTWLGSRRRSWRLALSVRRLPSGFWSICGGKLPALDDERRRRWPLQASCDEAEAEERQARHQRQKNLRSPKAFRARRTKAAARP